MNLNVSNNSSTWNSPTGDLTSVLSQADGGLINLTDSQLVQLFASNLKRLKKATPVTGTSQYSYQTMMSGAKIVTMKEAVEHNGPVLNAAQPILSVWYLRLYDEEVGGEKVDKEAKEAMTQLMSVYTEYLGHSGRTPDIVLESQGVDAEIDAILIKSNMLLTATTEIEE